VNMVYHMKIGVLTRKKVVKRRPDESQICQKMKFRGPFVSETPTDSLLNEIGTYFSYSRSSLINGQRARNECWRFANLFSFDLAL
jgi:hypothetical protein